MLTPELIAEHLGVNAHRLTIRSTAGPILAFDGLDRHVVAGAVDQLTGRP